jgi:hypothetical protein
MKKNIINLIIISVIFIFGIQFLNSEPIERKNNTINNQNIDVEKYLLYLNGEDFKNERISGIGLDTIKKHKISNEKVKSIGVVGEKKKNKNAKESFLGEFFGISEEKIDNLIKITFLILIFIVFILYRVKSKRPKRY